MRKLMILVLLVLAVPVLAQQPGLNKTKVLFVGYDPGKPLPDMKRSAPGMMSEKDFTAEYSVRMPAFKGLLSQYFGEVKTMDCRDWKPADSEPYDVTIFDFPTTVIEPAKQEKDEKGNVQYISARYLPDNFSKPVIFIASTADQMGRRIGLKLDWLCLCLDADAHHLNANHPIFKGPLEKVVPTMVTKKTPDGIFHYATGENIPKEIPMWRVQKTGYLAGKGARIGLVARGNRFAESPDAEMISSGVCQKDVGAVALGRHGNFFLWGFGAAPADMTEEGKKVFVNTVAYMKQFDGRIPIARKYNDRMATTDDVRETIANVTKKSYEDYVAQMKDFNDQNAKQNKRLNDKKAAGQALTPEEEATLPYLGRVQEIDTWEVFLKGRMGKLASRFGNDGTAFQKYLTDNFNYIYCDPKGFYDYWVDEDVQQIGISNHDVKLLDACVGMLKKNDQPELASKVLKRYTGENFSTAKEWDDWLSKNKKKLFFSETNGYRFVINTYSK
ncbi:hypothetical protein [Pedobacter frigoris]|uniref:hypothetical protein n=1 Tax=Pedobacter frigoris TaxID=2571272 RepID=UPI0029306A53|nr:hypothetical protein [Pedobacter frigoris]